jgi:hypothetical protein
LVANVASVFGVRDNIRQESFDGECRFCLQG